MPVTRIGLDLAKNVFQAHGVDEHGAVVLRKQLRRREVLSFFASLSPCLIGIEACSASHYYTASSLRTVVRRALGQLPIPELGWSRGHETMVSKLDAV